MTTTHHQFIWIFQKYTELLILKNRCNIKICKNFKNWNTTNPNNIDRIFMDLEWELLGTGIFNQTHISSHLQVLYNVLGVDPFLDGYVITHKIL